MKNSAKRWRSVKRNDFNRVLVTEVLPYETPIVFSTDGLYRQVLSSHKPPSVQARLFEIFVLGKIKPPGKHYNEDLRKPYFYKIRKGLSDFRTLGIVHPRSQWDIRNFYEEYEALILYYCSLSPYSIRAPRRQTTSFFVPNSISQSNRVKTGDITLHKHDSFLQYSPSFFSYRGYDRLYRFFGSREFLALEKRFDTYYALDVSKCFDSIYTHSISWAVKDRTSAKQSRHIKPTFGGRFDELMQSMNWLETNGIVIGPEVSRIFAEIILQSVDMDVLGKLKDDVALEYGQDYIICRYVDDVFIFTDTKLRAEKIAEQYRDALVAVHLQVNAGKTVTLSRPFVTIKSHVIREIGDRLDIFFKSFLIQLADSTVIVPRHIHSRFGLSRSFIASVKSVCAENCASYADVCNIIIGAIRKRIDGLTAAPLIAFSQYLSLLYRDALLVLFEVAFFFYTIAPSANESYVLSGGIVLAARYSQNYMTNQSASLAEALYEMTIALAESESRRERSGLSNLVKLEAINVLIAMKEWGPLFRVPETLVGALFNASAAPGYLELIACLFYVEDSPEYSNVRSTLLKTIDSRLADLKEVHRDAEQACLLLDILACPYIANDKKTEYLARLYSVFGLTGPLPDQLNGFFKNSTRNHWFVNWKGVDILNLLQKKKLVATY
jgi:hypothetical protein